MRSVPANSLEGKVTAIKQDVVTPQTDLMIVAS